MSATAPAVTKPIRSYLYWDYDDDDDLRAFIAAYNTLALSFLNWFNALNLPIYTGGVVQGLLLDWVLSGLYGWPRPVIGSDTQLAKGPYDSDTYDSLPYDGRSVSNTIVIVPTSDDLYRRTATWHFEKDYGKVFVIRWLKRRIMQFLLGTNGIIFNVDQTYQVSVTFGPFNQVSITLLQKIAKVTTSGCYDAPVYDRLPYDWSLQQITTLGPQFALASVLQDCIASGVLEVPFQFDFVVGIQ